MGTWRGSHERRYQRAVAALGTGESVLDRAFRNPANASEGAQQTLREVRRETVSPLTQAVTDVQQHRPGDWATPLTRSMMDLAVAGGRASGSDLEESMSRMEHFARGLSAVTS